jgi:hypothetical protein
MKKHRDAARTRANRKRSLRIEPLESRRLLSADLRLAAGSATPEGETSQLSWSIVPDGTPIEGIVGQPNGVSNLVSVLNQKFGNFDNWFGFVQHAFDAWDAISGVNFVYEPIDDGATFPTSDALPNRRGQIRLAGIHIVSAPETTSTLGFATSRQDLVINTDISDSRALLSQLTYVVTHELGHILGLDHSYPNNGTKLLEERENSDLFFAPQFDDILRLQSIFGDQFEPNNTLQAASDLQVLPIGVTQIGPVSIQDLADEDVYSFLGSQGQQISARVVPAGKPYLRAYQEQATYPTFDPRDVGDLRIELRDADGFLLGLASNNGAGATEVLDRVRLPQAGRYSIRVLGDSNETQAYELILELHPLGESSPTEQIGDTNWLIEQIQLANQSSTPVTINVPNGVYKLEQALPITGQVTLIGSGTAEVLIDGQNKTALFDAGTDSVLQLKNMTLLRGKGQNGGAVHGYQANVTLSNIVAVDNSAMGPGGAVYIFGGSVHIEHSTFSYNTSELAGGAIFLWQTRASIENSLVSDNKGGFSGGIDAQTSLTVSSTRILNNEPTGLSFGSSESAELTMRDSWVIGNRGEYGAGLSLGRGTSRLSGLHIEDNHAIYSGGGIRLADQGVMLLSNSYVSQNRANGSAGLHVGEGTRAEIRDSWFRKNNADSTAAGIGVSGLAKIESTTISENEAVGWFGGGIGVSDYGEMLLINSTVTRNKANNSGAGISSFAGAKLEIAHSTITDNQTLLTNFDQGGGIHVHNLGSAVLTNTVVAGNQNGQVTDIFGEFEASHSFLAAVDESTVLNHQRNGNFIGSASQPLDPKLGPLADNGGSTPTQRPVSDSPLLKAGLSLTESVRLDQRRVIRDIRPDIGAFEIPHGEEFTNLPPTLDPISDTPIHFLGLSSFQVRLTGITDGNQGRQPTFLSVASDNPALVQAVSVGDIVDGAAQLTYQLRPGVSGIANLTVTARDAGNDYWLGTDDDGSRQRSFRVAVVDGLLVEAEQQEGTNVNIRQEASGGATRQLQPLSPIEIDFQIQRAVRLSDLLIRHNNLVEGTRLEVQVDGGEVVAIALNASHDLTHFVIDSAQFDQVLSVGTHRFTLLLVGSTPMELDLLTAMSDSLPMLFIENAVQLEPRQGSESVDVNVYLSKPATSNVSFRMATKPQTATTGDGSGAIPTKDNNRDFDNVDRIVVIPAGSRAVRIPVNLYADQFLEQSERFEADISEAVQATIVRDQAIVEIVDGPIVLGSPVERRVKRAPELLEFIYIELHSIGPIIFPPAEPPADEPSDEPPLIVGQLLASAFRKADVTRDGIVSALDALQVINYLNSGVATRVPLDVNGDELISALDVLLIINEINSANTTSGAGEALSVNSFMRFVDGSYASDDESTLKRSRRIHLVTLHGSVEQLSSIARISGRPEFPRYQSN